MRTYIVHCTVNDGRNGYPNIIAELNWGKYSNKGVRSVDGYENAIRRHLMSRGAARAKGASGYIVKELQRGHVCGVNYRDYFVAYGAKDGNHADNPNHDFGENVTREVRVFCIVN